MKRYFVYFFAFFLIVCAASSVDADTLYLKNGGKVKGLITNITEEGYEVTVKSGKVFIKKSDVEKIEEGFEEVIEEKKPEYSNIPPENEKVVNGSTPGQKEIIFKKNTAVFSTTITPESRADSAFDKYGFQMYLDAYKDEEKKNDYLRNLLIKAQQTENEAYAAPGDVMAQKKLLAALNLYRSAAFSGEPDVNSVAQEGIARLTQKVIMPEAGKLTLPDSMVYKEITEFLKTLGTEEAQPYCNAYYKMGQDLEREADTLDKQSQDYKSKMGLALNCYNIVYNFTNDAEIKKEALTSIKRCNKRLIVERQ